MLKNTPSVTVNSEGDITLRGSTGFLVLVNGKPVQAEPSVILNQIPANTIENIEVITSPSARYDPDGKSGIVNITTKTTAVNSQTLTVNVQGGLPSTHTYNNLKTPQRFGADAAWGLRTGKWELNISGNYLRNDIAGRRVGDVRTTIGHIFTHFPSDASGVSNATIIPRGRRLLSRQVLLMHSRPVFIKVTGFSRGGRI